MTKEYYKHIRQCKGKKVKAGVNRIQINENNEIQITYKKAEIEKEIMTANKAKLLQASNIPCRQERLSILLGEQGDFEKWEEVRRGSISLPDDTEEDLKLWFQYNTYARTFIRRLLMDY